MELLYCISLLKRSLPGYQYCCVGKTWTERLPRQRRSRSRVKPGAAKGFHSIKPPEEEASKCNLNCVKPARFCTCCVQPLGRGNSRLFTLMATIHYSGDTDVRVLHSCTHSLRHHSHKNNHNNYKDSSFPQTLIAARSCVMTSRDDVTRRQLRARGCETGSSLLRCAASCVACDLATGCVDHATDSVGRTKLHQ